MYITSEFAIKPLIYMFKLMFIGTYKYFKIGLKFFCQKPIRGYEQNKGGFMNKPTESLLNAFYAISKSNKSLDLSLNWCEKRKAWGVLNYDFNVGSTWFCFFTFDRKRK